MTDRRAILDADRRHAWHPYTPMDVWLERAEPLVVVRAEGPWLFDADGRQLLDGNGSWWSSTLGHGHPRLMAALRRQAERFAHVAFAGITHEPAARLAEELCAIAPEGLSRVFFTDDGSTAVEAAIKLAVQYHQQTGAPERCRFAALEGAFHGDTVGAAALGGVEVFRRPFSRILLECVHVPFAADGYEQAFAALEDLLQREGGTLAAVVLEPLLQGAAGMRTYAPEYLRRVRELCTRQGVLLIFDEVFTGYGRTGTFWAAEQAGVAPDLMCVAKGFTAGVLPMGATLATEQVFDAFRGAPERAFYYGHTFCGHPLGAAVAREVLRVMREERVLEGVAERAALIHAALEPLRALPGVADVRSLGVMGAVELQGSGYLDGVGWRFFEAALRRGAVLRPLGNVVYLTPALNIPLPALEALLAIFTSSVREVLEA